MKTLKTTLVLLFLSTIAFSQSDKKVMLSDKVKEVMIEKLNYDYDSAQKVMKKQNITSLKDVEKNLTGELKGLKLSTCCISHKSTVFMMPVVLDGTPTGKTLEPISDIIYNRKSYKIKILSGEHAIALYGTSASKGVIVISSKEHKKRGKKTNKS
jgi:hypothetical protein